MQISSLIGKPVLSPGGTAYGYVTDVRFSRGYEKISCLICADGEEEEFYLPCRAVSAVRDAVIAGRGRLSAPSGIPSPIGKAVYTLSGQAHGFISDVTLGEDVFPLFTVSGEREKIPAVRFLIGEHAVLYPDPAAVKAAAKRNKRPKAASEPASSEESENGIPMSEDEPSKPPEPDPAVPPFPKELPPPGRPIPDPSEVPAPMPQRELSGRDLLGKKVRRTLCDGKGVPVAEAGARITPSVLRSVRKAGKLLELTADTLNISLR